MTTTMHGVEVPKALSRFVLDVHLGRLARYLRLLGFDASWKKDATDEELVAIATRVRSGSCSRGTASS